MVFAPEVPFGSIFFRNAFQIPKESKSKLIPQGDAPFQAFEILSDNAYKIHLPMVKYVVNNSSNISDLSLYHVYENFESRTTPLQDWGVDTVGSMDITIPRSSLSNLVSNEKVTS
jgi:hypothetical protein